MGHAFGCSYGSYIDWRQRHVVGALSALLSSGCLVYGAFVAAVAAMVSVLAWACLGCSFLAFCFQVLFNKNAIKRKQKAKTSPAGLLGLILAL